MTSLRSATARFPLPWSHYVKLLSVQDGNARQFYETEALRGGWSVRQLDRQISSQEEALIHKLEDFLLELGGDFAFMGRQKRLRIGDEWYRIDLLFFHRKLKCLVVIDLKLSKLTHADTGQMHLYLNYAREHWTHAGENPPVGLILCAKKDEAVAHYSLEGLPNKVMAAEYRMVLPNEEMLTEELKKTQRALELQSITSDTSPQKPRVQRSRKKPSKRSE